MGDCADPVTGLGARVPVSIKKICFTLEHFKAPMETGARHWLLPPRKMLNLAEKFP